MYMTLSLTRDDKLLPEFGQKEFVPDGYAGDVKLKSPANYRLYKLGYEDWNELKLSTFRFGWKAGLVQQFFQQIFDGQVELLVDPRSYLVRSVPED